MQLRLLPGEEVFMEMHHDHERPATLIVIQRHDVCKHRLKREAPQVDACRLRTYQVKSPYMAFGQACVYEQ